MTARSLGEILHGLQPAKATRTFQPVRRDSYDSTDPRASRLWRPLGSKQEARKIIGTRLKAAKNYDRQNKQPGQRNGPLGHVALEVLSELYGLVDYKTGRCDPAISTICQKIRRSKDAVCKALKRLKEHGFLDWVRRTEPVDNPGAGPQLKQISNAYGFGLPKCAADFVRKLIGPAPLPDCEVTRQENNHLELKKMFECANLDEQIDFICDTPELNALLKTFGNAVSKKERESAERSESTHES